jgi:hypothetical protein
VITRRSVAWVLKVVFLVLSMVFWHGVLGKELVS